MAHIEGDVNPVRDMGIIMEELRKKDEEYILKHYDTLSKSAMRGDKKVKTEFVSKIIESSSSTKNQNIPAHQ